MERNKQYGLRFDLDKRVFIGHLQDEQAESILEEAALALVEILGAEL